ncbi:MAG: sialate O-acetylesterase [Prevotella sp.]|nr:sialate O-acetylesterase [Prevotella sp.]
MKRLTCVFCALCGIISTALAEVKLPQFFSDGMVLQQQTTARLWGWTQKNRKVTVKTSWDDKTYTATTNNNGRFEVSVTTPAAGGPYTIVFDDGQPIRLSNVLIGEVWICSGQSNMEMQMKGFKGQPVEGTTEELLHCKDPQLRFFTVKRNPKAQYQEDATGQWNEAETASVRDLSATAYYFGKALRNNLDVPVGLIVTSYGGSACEAWMAREWLEEDTIAMEWPKYYPDVKFPITDEMVEKLHQRCPTALYNGQLKPLIGYALRGAIWYQGEDNVPRYSYYAKLLKRMVDGWRAEWQQGDFPFYFCQIAPYDYSLIQWEGSQYLREQQLKAEIIIPNSRMACLMDAGLEYGIHPRKKRQAGERLAVLALSNTYGVKGLPDFATYANMDIQGDTVVVAFDRSKEWVYFENGKATDGLYEVAGEDHVFHQAEAWISRNRLYLKSEKVKKPVAVRYAWKDWVQGDLMHDGLPVSSFRSRPTPALPKGGNNQ